MNQRLRRSLGITALLTPLAVSAGCSLVNAFDDVKPEADASTTPDAETPDNFVPVGDGGTDAPIVQETGPIDAGPPKGAIVLGASVVKDGGEDLVLTALAPEDGSELQSAREKMKVEAVLYDGERDLWYIFESGGQDFFPTPSEPVFLHVRKLDTHTGEWTELSRTKVPTLVSFTMATVVRERLVYVAYDTAPDGSFTYQLVTLDTSNPASISTLASPLPLAKVPLGIIGTRTDVGLGLVTLLSSGPCAEAGNCVVLTRVLVPDTGSPSVGGVTTTTSRFAGSPAYGSFLGGGPADVIASRVSFSSTAQDTTVSMYSPQTADPVGTPFTFKMTGANLKPLAFSECQGAAIVGETNTDPNVYAVPMDGGAAISAGTGHSGQGVYYEPYTSTVLAPFSQGSGYSLTAFHLGGGTLVKRDAPGWSPPRGLRPHIVATRTPVPFKECP